MTSDPTVVVLSGDCYRLFLRMYPSEFRAGFQDETLRVFRDDCRDTYASGGRLALLWLWLRTLPDVIGCAAGEHLAAWMADHPARQRSAPHQILLSVGLALGVVAVFLVDSNTPAEVPLAIMYACLLFTAGALLPPERSLLIAAATLGVYVVDGWIAPSGWTMYRGFGLVALLVAGLWAIRTGADHARLRAKIAGAAAEPNQRSGIRWPMAARCDTNPASEAAIEVMQALLLRRATLDEPELAAALRHGIERVERLRTGRPELPA